MDSEPHPAAQTYANSLKTLKSYNWSGSSLNVNIPGHPEERLSSPSGRYEVEISPKNGYDDGKLHEERLHFFVNVYTYHVDEDGNRIEEEGLISSTRFDAPRPAVELAQLKIEELNKLEDS